MGFYFIWKCLGQVLLVITKIFFPEFFLDTHPNWYKYSPIFQEFIWRTVPSLSEQKTAHPRPSYLCGGRGRADMGKMFHVKRTKVSRETWCQNFLLFFYVKRPRNSCIAILFHVICGRFFRVKTALFCVGAPNSVVSCSGNNFVTFLFHNFVSIKWVNKTVIYIISTLKTSFLTSKCHL